MKKADVYVPPDYDFEVRENPVSKPRLEFKDEREMVPIQQLLDEKHYADLNHHPLFKQFT